MPTEAQVNCDGILFASMQMKLVCTFVAKNGADYGIAPQIVEAAKLCAAGTISL